MLGSATVNPVKRTILLAQAAWAARTVRLAPEPEGERSGIARERLGATLSEYLRLVAVGDSLVAGSGASSQATALTPPHRRPSRRGDRGARHLGDARAVGLHDAQGPPPLP